MKRTAREHRELSEADVREIAKQGSSRLLAWLVFVVREVQATALKDTDGTWVPGMFEMIARNVAKHGPGPRKRSYPAYRICR